MEETDKVQQIVTAAEEMKKVFIGESLNKAFQDASHKEHELHSPEGTSFKVTCPSPSEADLAHMEKLQREGFSVSVAQSTLLRTMDGGFIWPDNLPTVKELEHGLRLQVLIITSQVLGYFAKMARSLPEESVKNSPSSPPSVTPENCAKTDAPGDVTLLN